MPGRTSDESTFLRRKTDQDAACCARAMCLQGATQMTLKATRSVLISRVFLACVGAEDRCW